MTQPRYETEKVALGFEGCPAWFFLPVIYPILSELTKVLIPGSEGPTFCLESYLETACKQLLKGISKHYFDS